MKRKRKKKAFQMTWTQMTSSDLWVENERHRRGFVGAVADGNAAVRLHSPRVISYLEGLIWLWCKLLLLLFLPQGISDPFIHSFNQSGDLYSASSRDFQDFSDVHFE